MQLYFLKNAGSYRKGQTYEIKPQLARVLIHVRTARLADDSQAEKEMTVPENRMLPAAPVTKTADHEDEAKAPAPRRAPPKKPTATRTPSARKKAPAKKTEKKTGESGTDKND